MKYKLYYLDQLYDRVANNQHVTITDKALPKPARKEVAEYEAKLPPELAKFYQEANGLTLRWQAIDQQYSEATGSVNILPCRHLFDETVWIIEPELLVINDDLAFANKANITGVFRRVDLFTDESSVGYFSDPQLGRQLYYGYGHRFYAMKLDFAGYFRLLCAARAYLYWQHAILYTEYSYGKVEYERFRVQMPLLFPDFNWDTFLALYQELKLQ